MELTNPQLRRIFAIAPKTLGLFRLLVASVVIWDCLKRWPQREDFYSASGLAPLEVTREFYAGSWNWSVFWLHESLTFQTVVLGLLITAAAGLLIGLATRWTTVAVWVLLASLQTRTPALLTGGDVLLLQLVFWGMFLPWGRIWSIDAYRSPEQKLAAPVASFATMGLMMQIVMMYFFTALWKTNSSWLGGHALQIVLEDEMLVKPLGRWLLQFPSLLTLATRATWLLELVAGFLLLSPIWTHRVRLIALGGLFFLHVGIEMTMEVLVFSLASLAALTVFLPESFWQAGCWRIFRRTSQFANQSVTAPQRDRMENQSAGNRLPGVIVGVWLGYLFTYNMINWYYAGWPEELAALHHPAEVTASAQTWDMFAHPEDLRRRFVLAARLPTGKLTDALRDVEVSPPFQRPASAGRYPSPRWMLAFRQISSDHFRYFRPSTLTAYLKHAKLLDETLEAQLIEFAYRAADQPPLELAYVDLRAEGAFHQGLPHGKWIHFDDAGGKTSEGEYRLGKQTGEWRFYYPDGNLKELGHFRLGEMHGVWSFFDPDGGVRKASFQNGSMVEWAPGQ